MNSKSLIKAIKYMDITALICAVLICGYIVVFGSSSAYRITAAGAGIGAAIGCIIDLKLILPKKFKDKDERTVIVMLLSLLFANSLCFMTAFVVLAFIVLGALDIMNFTGFAVFTLCILLIYYAVEKITYKVLNDKI